VSDLWFMAVITEALPGWAEFGYLAIRGSAGSYQGIVFSARYEFFRSL
jgi:hypothetical protein